MNTTGAVAAQKNFFVHLDGCSFEQPKENGAKNSAHQEMRPPKNTKKLARRETRPLKNLVALGLVPDGS